MNELVFEDWGLLNYEVALKRQIELVEKVSTEDLPGYLVFCSHTPVVTIGSATKPEDVFSWSGPLVEVTRGGRATYHGPSQVVVYPIVNLTHIRKGRQDREISAYLRSFEDAIVSVLRGYGLENVNSSPESDHTGIWIQERKLVSVGIGIRKWVSFHGAAINLLNDRFAFAGIKPCGFPAEVMISVEEALQEAVDIAEFKERLKRSLLEAL